MNFEAVIGLEIHVELSTKSKMFSSAPVTFGEEPNTQVGILDIAFPGSMPTVNKQAIIYAIRVCHALHMDIDDELWFDRKNYFYSDLPKGYQITQKTRPIGKNGYLDITVEGKTKRIELQRLHIEEDTCKQLHFKNYTLLDYNRAGIPLLEIVTEPDLSNGAEAMKFVEKIRSIVTFLNVSSGKMEEGSLRCDVNVSLKPIGSKVLGTNVEIKNINSLSNIQKAIDYEIRRQEIVLLSGLKVKKETRRFNENKKQTEVMRDKTADIDYKYFTEPNIAPIKLTKEFIEEAIESSPELLEQKLERFKEMGLNEYDSTLLTNNKNTCDYFEETISCGANPKLVANWINVDIQEILNKQNIEIDKFSIKPNQLSELIQLIEKGEITNKQGREIFIEMIQTSKSASTLVKEKQVTILSNESALLEIIKQVIDNNPRIVIDYKNGKDRIVGYIVGQVNKITKGKADLSIVNRLAIKELKER